MLSFSDLRTDPRVRRHLALLAPRFAVTAAGFRCPENVAVQCIEIPGRHWTAFGKWKIAALLAAHRFAAAYDSLDSVRQARERLRGASFDLVVANDLWTLPAALEIARGGKVILDAHEYAPREFEDRVYWRLLFSRFNDHLCRRYLPQAAGMLTVCQGIADAYHANYGVQPKVLVNALPYQSLTPRSIATDRIRIIHHGGAIRSREIELMIELAHALDDRFQLDLMLVPVDPAYYERLRARVAGQSRVRLVAPVPMVDLPLRLNEYDIGLYLLPPNSFNNRYALPNKFFEFIQARLAVAIGPSPEMARLVKRYDCGIVSEDFDPRSLARRLNALDRDEIDRFKQRSHEAAKDLCFEKTAPVLLEMCEQLLGGA